MYKCHHSTNLSALAAFADMTKYHGDQLQAGKIFHRTGCSVFPANRISSANCNSTEAEKPL